MIKIRKLVIDKLVQFVGHQYWLINTVLCGDSHSMTHRSGPTQGMRSISGFAKKQSRANCGLRKLCTLGESMQGLFENFEISIWRCFFVEGKKTGQEYGAANRKGSLAINNHEGFINHCVFKGSSTINHHLASSTMNKGSSTIYQQPSKINKYLTNHLVGIDGWWTMVVCIYNKYITIRSPYLWPLA